MKKIKTKYEIRKERQRKNIQRYIDKYKNTFEYYKWEDISNHVENLIEYYSYILDNSSRAGKINETTYLKALQMRLFKLVIARDMLAKDVKSEKIRLNYLDLNFLEWHLREEIKNKVQNKDLINLDTLDIPGIIYTENEK